MERICFSQASEVAPESVKEEVKEVRYAGIAFDLNILNWLKQTSSLFLLDVHALMNESD